MSDPNNPYPPYPPQGGYPPQPPYPPADPYLQAQPPYSGQPYAPIDPNQPPPQPYAGQPYPPPPYGYDPAAQAAETLRAKQAQRSKWAKWSGYVVFGLLLVRLALYLLPSSSTASNATITASGPVGTVRVCEDTGLQADVLKIVNDLYRKRGGIYTATGLSNIVTASSTAELNTCTATVLRSDNNQEPLTYTESPTSVRAGFGSSMGGDAKSSGS